jgi:hypothetical protein
MEHSASKLLSQLWCSKAKSSSPKPFFVAANPKAHQHDSEPVEMMDSFTYDALDKSKDDVRLATLLSYEDGTIYCSLHTYSLTTTPKFVALSYAWGSAENKRNLIVNGKPFSIREKPLARVFGRYGNPSYWSIPMSQCYFGPTLSALIK